MKTLNTFLLIASVIVFASKGHSADLDSLSSKNAFEKGASLMEQGKHKEAIPYFKHVQKEDPGNPNVLWNLGIACAEVGSYREALETWQKYRNAEPNDWLARPKIIQSYQALGETKSRDKEIKELYASRDSGQDSKLKNADRFCREQFTVDGKKVFAFEYFAPKDPRMMYYRFSIVDQKGNEDFYISLGSYKSTVDIARDLGELKADERLYHLDHYQKSSHMTFGFYKQKPEYEDIRKSVEKIIKGELKPMSGVNPGR
jgi:tetratricopeptide (TPR) repeat protein